MKEMYVKTLQDFQDRSLVKASLWTFRTIGDLRSVIKKSNVLRGVDRVMIFLRGILAVLIWLPVNLVAIPYLLILRGLHRKYRKMVPTAQLHEIIPGLYLGTVQAAKSESLLKKHHITSVLSILDFKIDIPKQQVPEPGHISMEDSPHVDLAPAIKQAILFVEKARDENRNILVHCNMGKSRSASIMVALVQKIWQVDAKTAFNHVRFRRQAIDINYGFKKQLFRNPIKGI